MREPTGLLTWGAVRLLDIDGHVGVEGLVRGVMVVAPLTLEQLDAYKAHLVGRRHGGGWPLPHSHLQGKNTKRGHLHEHMEKIHVLAYG